MTIENVQLIHKKEIKEGTMQDGLPVAAQPELFAFLVDTAEDPDKEVVVPNDPTNGHYREVAEWYKAQDKKPFEFDFHDFEKSDNAAS